jgi:hypothetical protein
MDETARLGLPLLQAAQAQKHVTVNAALARLDGLLPLVIVGRDRVDPPDPAPEGAVWAVPEGATGAWTGQAGRLALAVNGGWEFVTPDRGWTAFIEAEGRSAIHDGSVHIDYGADSEAPDNPTRAALSMMPDVKATSLRLVAIYTARTSLN